MNKLPARVLMYVLITTFMFGLTGADAITLPGSLTAIENEAFMGDAALNGVLRLPASVKTIGKDAFTGTRLYALDVPAGTSSLGAQSFQRAAYVYVHGASTTVGSLSGVEYVIGPAGSQAQTAAAASGVDFVAENQLVEAGGFYYSTTADGLILLSAKDATTVGSSVTIPASVGNKEVVGVSDYAFVGCSSLTSVQLPESLRGSVPASALADCQQAAVEYYGSSVTVKDVTTDVSAGASGNSITWNVDANAEGGVSSYLYTVQRNGVDVLSLESTSSSFTYEAQEAGEYQLLVTVTDRNGNRATGQSTVLYIAVEIMSMSVPESLTAGHDLEITVDEVPGAKYYTVFVTNEATGEAATHIRNQTKPGKITVSGYELAAGTYRVTGYVIGNDFRYTVPTVKYVTISGTQAQGPAVPAQKPHLLGMSSIGVKLSDTETYALRYRYVYSDGTTNDWNKAKCNPGQTIYINPPSNSGDWSNGGKVLLQGALLQNGAWTDWGPVTEVEVMTAPKLATPEFTMATSVAAGSDVLVKISEVENAENYDISLWKGYSDTSGQRQGESLWNEGVYYLSSRNVTIPGYYLDAGVYTIQVTVWRDGYEHAYSQQRLEVTGTRPAAPSITADKTEVYTGQSVHLDINYPGGEGAIIQVTPIRPDGGDHYVRWTYHMALNSSGHGSELIIAEDSDCDGMTHLCQVSVIVNGQWSEFATFSFLQKPREPLAPVVINGPTTIEAGQDYEFSFTGVEHAENYRINWGPVYGGETNYMTSGLDQAGKTLTIPGNRLTSVSYWISVAAESVEYGNSRSELLFTLRGTRSAAPKVTVDKTVVAPQEQFTFTIDTTDAELLCCREYSSGYSFSYTNINVLEDTTLWSTSDWSPSQSYYTFSVFKDGKWSDWSEPILVTSENASVEAPTITMPSTLSLGSDLNVTVAPVSNATRYDVRLYNRAGTRVSNKQISGSEGGTVTFDGYLFSANRYTVEVEVFSSNGSNTAEATVNVQSATRPAAPAATADSDTGRLNVAYGFTIPTAGVEKAAVRYYRADATNSVSYEAVTVTGDSTRWSDYQYNAGHVWNYSFAVKKDGVWSPWSPTLQITITNREQLGQTVLTMPETVEAGQDVRISFAPVANAETYHLYLSTPDGSEVSYYSNYPNQERLLNGYDLMPGTYKVRVQASAASYDSSNTEKSFTVTGTRPAAPVATVDKTSVLTNETFTFIIENGDAELIAYRYKSDGGSSSTNTLNAPTDVTAWDNYMYSSGTYTFSFCTLKDGKWSAWSTGIPVKVGARPALPAPVLTLPDSVDAGRDLTVSFSPVDGASYYYVYLYDLRGNSISSRYLNGTTHSATFAGYMLPANYVRVEVTAYGTNGGSSNASATLKVNPGALPAAPSVTPPESSNIPAGEYFTFTASAPGAEMYVVRYYRIGSPNSMNYSTFAADKSYRSSRSESGATWAYSFAAQVDGVWSAWSDYIELNVE